MLREDLGPSVEAHSRRWELVVNAYPHRFTVPGAWRAESSCAAGSVPSPGKIKRNGRPCSQAAGAPPRRLFTAGLPAKQCAGLTARTRAVRSSAADRSKTETHSGVDRAAFAVTRRVLCHRMNDEQPAQPPGAARAARLCTQHPGNRGQTAIPCSCGTDPHKALASHQHDGRFHRNDSYPTSRATTSVDSRSTAGCGLPPRAHVR
jgi:hypothetical protein